MFVKVPILCLAFLAAGVAAYEDKTIAQWLTDNGYTTLVSLLKAANLYDTLDNQATGPLTLFAPTDAAFATVPVDTLNSLKANPTVLATVLKYHILDGFNLAPLIHNGTVKQSQNGQNLLFKKASDGTIMVEGAHITTADQIVNNGVIHVIDNVLMPVTETIGEVLLEHQDKYSTLNVLLQITDLEPQLMGGSVTLFAPTDAAFQAIQAALPAFTSANVKAIYTEILKNHVINGTYFARDLVEGQRLTTLHGQTVVVHLTNGVMIDNTAVVDPDIKAANGVIHGINGVLLPTDLAA